MPVGQLGFASSEFGPIKKILIAAAVSEELQSSTPATATAVISAALAAAAEKSLDSVVFGAGAGDPATPQGLLHGRHRIARVGWQYRPCRHRR